MEENDDDDDGDKVESDIIEINRNNGQWAQRDKNKRMYLRPYNYA